MNPSVSIKAGKFLFYALLFLAFVLLYHEVAAHIFHRWRTPDGSHGPLILGISFYLIWFNRDAIRSLRPEPAVLPGSLLLGAGCFLYITGSLGATILLKQVSMVPVILGGLLLFGGYPFFKVFLLPVGYLIFLTGLVETLLGGIAIYLQLITASISAAMFRLIGFPVFHEGIILALPHITLEVVRSCSGISHIVALMALAVPLAYLTQRTMVQKLVLLVSALFIGIFANGLRVFLIGVYALYNKGADLHGPNETLYVSFIFFFGIVVLIILANLLSRWDDKRRPKDKTDPDEPDTPAPRGTMNSPRRERAAYIAGAGIILLTLGFVYLHTPKIVGPAAPLELFPTRISGFTGTDVDQVHRRLRPFPADSELLRVYENENGKQVMLYIGYFASQDRENKVIDYRRAWMHEDFSRVSFENDGKRVAINKTRLRDRDAPKDVYYWYLMDGRIITSQYTGKIATFWNALFKRRTNAAVVVIATQDEGVEIMNLIAALSDTIRTHL